MGQISLFDIFEEVKFCRRCQTHKPISDFYKINRDGKQKLRFRCKSCEREYRRVPAVIKRKRAEYQRYKTDPKCIEDRKKAAAARHKNGKTKGYYLKKMCGLTFDEFKKLELAQNYLCAVCGNPETSVDSRLGKAIYLAVDHCHLTGKVRQLLCGKCNRMIGMANEDASLLRKAAEYLEKHAE